MRLPRFRRSPSIAPMALTPRDLDIIRAAFRFRFLRSTHLASLFGGSRQVILRRLQLLFHHGYLDRPRAQIDYYRNGSQPMVYGLGNKGTARVGVIGFTDWCVFGFSRAPDPDLSSPRGDRSSNCPLPAVPSQTRTAGAQTR